MEKIITDAADKMESIQVSEIDLDHPIYLSPKTIIVKHKNKVKNNNCILKTTDFIHPAPERLSMARHEYEIISSINSKSVIKTYGLAKLENGLAILLEDFPGINLLEFSDKNRDNIPLLLELFIQTTEGLSAIHKNNIIHKDIKPQNILVNESEKTVRIIDFDISTRTQGENFSGDEVLKLEGTLAYLSPEQTGRMNRSIDYRTDYYSLGATFFEVLTGRKVFPESDDKLETIHSHIAKSPDSPKSLNPEIPNALSDILLKLLEKRAENRYQSSIGILYDLNLCRTKLVNNNDFSFRIGEKDIPEKFRIPEKLYGRENEVATIFNTFTRSQQEKTQLILISGNSGSGKSFLVQEVQKPISKGNL